MDTQARAIEAQSLETAKALEIAERSAQAAERLAAANEAFAVSTHRAWLTIAETRNKVYWLRPDHPKVRIVFNATVKNTGNTPATDVKLSQCAQCEFPRDRYEDHQSVDAGSVSLGVGATSEILCAFEIADEQFEEMRRLGLDLVVSGEAEYGDIFGRRHYTKWVFELDFATEQFVARLGESEIT
jgi:hypothetical protein